MGTLQDFAFLYITRLRSYYYINVSKIRILTLLSRILCSFTTTPVQFMDSGENKILNYIFLSSENDLHRLAVQRRLKIFCEFTILPFFLLTNGKYKIPALLPSPS